MRFIKKINEVSFLNKILIFTIIIFGINLLLFATFLIKDVFFRIDFAGDESKYLGDLLKANSFGLTSAINEGASITYLTISYLLDKIIQKPLLTLKLTSVLFGILMFLSLLLFNSKLLKIKNPLKVSLFFWLIYLFVIQTTFFSGVNDILLDFFGTLLFISLYLKYKSIFLKIVLTGLFLALILATRKMGFTYIFVFVSLSTLLGIYLKNTTFFNFRNGILILCSFSIFFILMNLFPLTKYKRFSFDDKVLAGNINWAQWDYHNALLIDQGIQERFQHIDIRETEIYLHKYGKNSLPSSFLEMVIFNPLLTLKEFFIDSAIGLMYIFRQTGFLIFPFCYFLFYRTKKMLKKQRVTTTDFIYLFSTSYFFLICLIVVANIQARWFMFFMPIMMLLICKDLNTANPQKQIMFAICNNLILTIMCYPYLFEKMKAFFLENEFLFS